MERKGVFTNNFSGVVQGFAKIGTYQIWVSVQYLSFRHPVCYHVHHRSYWDA